jgi:hypothetical protein
MGVALYGRTEEPPVAGDDKLLEEDPVAVADGAAAKPMPPRQSQCRCGKAVAAANKRHLIQLIRGTTRETTMDF